MWARKRVFHKRSLTHLLRGVLLLLSLLYAIQTTKQLVASSASATSVGSEAVYCSNDLRGNKAVLDQIAVSPTSERDDDIKILCFIMTYSGYHLTRVRDVLATWGKRCDGLVITTDSRLPSIDVDDLPYRDKIRVVPVDVPPTWGHLWTKLRATMDWISEHSFDGYDWFLKADDDTYVIMENLRAFLRTHGNPNVPQLFGRKFGLQREKFQSDMGRSSGTYLKGFVRKYYDVQGNESFPFAAGGPSYVMNPPYFQLLRQAMRNETILPREKRGKLPPEDVAHAVVVYDQSQGQLVGPLPTRDDLGRERFHMFSPAKMMHVDDIPWVHRLSIDGISAGLDCCSTSTISFHQMEKTPGLMHYVETQLYNCRE